MWLSEIFTEKELENKTKNLYHTCRGDISAMKEKFEDFFGVSYELAFGKEDPEKCIINLLNNYYQNEYYIKSSFSNKYIGPNRAIFEYPVKDSRADIIDVHNSLECYEIKTKYDNLERLTKQINDYSRVFEYVYVVCSYDKLNEVEKKIPNYCGIITYKNRINCAFNKQKKAKISPNFSINELLNCFYKKELKKYFNTYDIYEICNKCSDKQIINCYKKTLQARYFA